MIEDNSQPLNPCGVILYLQVFLFLIVHSISPFYNIKYLISKFKVFCLGLQALWKPISMTPLSTESVWLPGSIGPLFKSKNV